MYISNGKRQDLKCHNSQINAERRDKNIPKYQATNPQVTTTLKKMKTSVVLLSKRLETLAADYLWH